MVPTIATIGKCQPERAHFGSVLRRATPSLALESPEIEASLGLKLPDVDLETGKQTGFGLFTRMGMQDQLVTTAPINSLDIGWIQ